MTRRPRPLVGPLLCGLALLAGLPAAAPAYAQQVHGENATFVGSGIAIVWGILRGAAEADTRVVLRIAPAGAAFAALSLEGVDPFTRRREEFVAIRPLGGGVDLYTARSTFADFPRREIHFYTADDQRARRSSLTVYFMGLPDTTPEFATETALGQYLADTMRSLTRAKGPTP